MHLLKMLVENDSICKLGLNSRHMILSPCPSPLGPTRPYGRVHSLTVATSKQKSDYGRAQRVKFLSISKLSKLTIENCEKKKLDLELENTT